MIKKKMKKLYYILLVLLLTFIISCNNEKKQIEIVAKETPIKEISGELKRIEGGNGKFIRFCIPAEDENYSDTFIYQIVGETQIKDDRFTISNLYDPPFKYLRKITEQFPVRLLEYSSDSNVFVSIPTSELVIVDNQDVTDYEAGVKIRYCNGDPIKFMPGSYYTMFIYSNKDVKYKGKNFVKSLDPVSKEVVFVFEYDLLLKAGWNKLTYYYKSIQDEVDITGESDAKLRTSRFVLFSGELPGQEWYIYTTKIFKDG